MPDDNTEREDDIVEGEVLAEYPGETYLNLPPVPDEGAAERAVVGPPQPIDTGRRSFLLQIFVGGVGALALGGSAALLVDAQRRRSQPRVVILPNGAEVDSTDVAGLYERIATLNDSLQSTLAERDDLQGRLAQATADLDDARLQLADALTAIDGLRSINDLWQQLDNIGLDTLLGVALGTLGSSLTTLLALVTVLRGGLTSARQSVNSFVTKLPGPQQGVQWLGQQITMLSQNLDNLGQQVQQAVEPVEPYTQMIAQFVLWVVDRLPFGVGAKATAGLQAMQTVINSLPALVEGVNTTVLVPLADWFGQDSASNLPGTLISPVVDKVFDPADKMLEFGGLVPDDFPAGAGRPHAEGPRRPLCHSRPDPGRADASGPGGLIAMRSAK